MIKALGHDVICDICESVTHCSAKEPWPHKDVYVSTDPKHDAYDNMLKIHICKGCWPSKTEQIKKTIAVKFLEFMGVRNV